MALFGSLDTMPLPEILGLLSGKEGALELWNLKGVPPTTLYLRPGFVRAVVQGGKPLDREAAKAALKELLLAEGGSFEFHPGARPKGGEDLALPIERLLLSFTTLQDELAHYRPYLPHPEARFTLAGPSPEEPRYKEFFRRALPYLKRGASAVELSQALHLPLDEARLYLYKLQGLGAVKRAEVEARPKDPGLLRRLLAHLRAAWGL
ncbi:DUF4388 domain-containing protein [Thermus sp.]|uniref:DUF4388 domain-containing protein n=1 Tax=Thermus sp. TaxID=275 RepID=UPI003D110F1D